MTTQNLLETVATAKRETHTNSALPTLFVHFKVIVNAGHATPHGARNLAKAARLRYRCVHPRRRSPARPGTALEILCCTARRYSTWCSTAIMAGRMDRGIPGAPRRHESDKIYKDTRIH